MFVRSLTVASALVATAANAATIALERTVDLTTVDLSHNLWLEQELPSPVYLQTGDTLDLTLHFAPHQTLRIKDPIDIYAWVLVPIDPVEVYFESDASFSFLGPKGSTPSAPIADFEYNGNGQFGNIIEAIQLPNALEFNGIRLTARAVSFSTDGLHAYRFSVFSFRGAEFSMGTVPEPATWAMLIAGFGLVGATARRSQNWQGVSGARVQG